MGNGWRALRRRILTPNVSATSLDVRGFHKKSPQAQELLETVGRTFLDGYAYAVEARDVAAAEARLEQVPTRFQGFAYEGAAMGYAMLDGLPLGGGRHVVDFLAGRAQRHVYMVYVGIGWAMARLPRFRWPRGDVFDPLLRWLILDGYGFHQAYFATRRYVHEHYREPAFPWPADARGYADSAIDQGIGRALWFVGGTDPRRVTELIDRFPRKRHADLYGGVGLAAAYAGGGDSAELVLLRERAGEHRAQVAQGAAFAAEARVRAELLVPHTERAAQVLCGTSAVRAAELTQRLRPESPVDGELPAYEVWRQRIAAEFVSLGGVTA
ncbi:Protein of unknown function [Amycolatopsis arida]|uniref:Enediyne biosynthesis protein n=1 Tax=Amycolatopsis arida TaxID=587909 RepID=A0A1I5MJ06_9PSEU|nr:DUF1702 family protein [Amycolatopsis arida]SFP09500.1 Protein of unknown function [Amycolatopsis arida]